MDAIYLYKYILYGNGTGDGDGYIGLSHGLSYGLSSGRKLKVLIYQYVS
ncbi:hypothetical protein [Calorimonas adulescens]|jgi:hypothetical protein|nr:hypothetical protein [Calorimonas adulescens]